MLKRYCDVCGKEMSLNGRIGYYEFILGRSRVHVCTIDCADKALLEYKNAVAAEVGDDAEKYFTWELYGSKGDNPHYSTNVLTVVPIFIRDVNQSC